MATILLSIGVLGVAVVLLAMRILLVRDGEFRGTCGSNNPYLRNTVGECWACGKTEEEECEYRDAKSARVVGPVLDRLTSRRR
jgi:hypothetical protein